MAKVVWTESALSDLAAIYDYVARDSPTYAARLMESLVQASQRLENFPFSGHVIDEFRREDIRQILRGSYRVVYSIRNDACYIMSVIHASRDPLRLLNPEEWRNG